MADTNKTTLYVIVEGPPRHGRPGTCYVAPDGTTTEHKSRAATFGTGAEAKAFAKVMGLTLDGARTYIAREDFTDMELQGQ